MQPWEAPGASDATAASSSSGSCWPAISLLVALHIVLGLTMPLVALIWIGVNWSFWVRLPMFGLVCSEALLLGMWLGFARTSLWLKLLGFCCGLGWFLFLEFAPAPGRVWRLNQIDDAAGPLLAVVFAAAIASLACHWLAARLVHKDDWPARPLAQEMQFTLKSIVGLTITVAALLALRDVVRWAYTVRIDDEVTLLVFALIGVLAWLMLLWATLGQGRPTVRIPVMLAGMAALGLIFPYYAGGPAPRYDIWPALTVTIGVYSSASLLVVRHCGYRLVSVWRTEDAGRGF
jgi:hypothetical protein